ncbi:hypothetical protein GGER_51280 [Serratia rubidaea]
MQGVAAYRPVGLTVRPPQAAGARHQRTFAFARLVAGAGFLRLLLFLAYFLAYAGGFTRFALGTGAGLAFGAGDFVAQAAFVLAQFTQALLIFFQRAFQGAQGFLTRAARLLQLLLLGLLFAQQGFLLLLLGDQRGFLLRQFRAGLLQLFDIFLARFVQIAEVSQDTLAALALFTAQDQLYGAVLPLTERGVQLSGQDVLLLGLLLLQLGDRGVKAGDIFA